ncbi:hypothetical protein J6590_051384 [Homalodisca vitripennis]|nr:hypothetical protein J6590_051384 [Homalodisca vitripennis]
MISPLTAQPLSPTTKGNLRRETAADCRLTAHDPDGAVNGSSLTRERNNYYQCLADNGSQLVDCSYGRLRDFRTTTNGRSGGLLARTGSLSGHPSEQQPRSTLLDPLSDKNIKKKRVANDQTNEGSHWLSSLVIHVTGRRYSLYSQFDHRFNCFRISRNGAKPTRKSALAGSDHSRDSFDGLAISLLSVNSLIADGINNYSKQALNWSGAARRRVSVEIGSPADALYKR